MSQDPTPPNPPSSAPPPPPTGSGPSAPPPPGGGAGGGGPRLPWEERERLGFGPAFVETAKLIFTQPRDAFSRLRPDGDYVWPLVFGGGVAYVAGLIAQVWNILLSGVVDFGMGGGGMGMMGGVGAIFMWLILGPIFIVIGVLLLAGICHLLLMATQSVAGSPFGFEGTYKAVCYAFVASVGNVIPLVGGLVTLALLAYLLIHAFQAVHRTSQTNSLIATLVPLGLCFVCSIVGIVFSGAGMLAGLA